MSTTLFEEIYANEKRFADRVFLTQPSAGEVVDYTYGEMMRQARLMAAYLKAQGFAPGDRIGLVAKNSAHFFISEVAIWMAGYVTVAIYPTANHETISYILEHSEVKLLLLGKLDTWETDVKPAIRKGLPCVALPLAPETGYPTWDEVTKGLEPLAGEPKPARDDLALILYTSGSTGQPKGVMHSFAAATDAGRGIIVALAITENDRALSYLPLAHVFERAYIEVTSLIAGFHVFFAESLETFVADLRRARPTIFISVPRLWLKFQMGVFTKMPKKRLELLLKIPIVKGIIQKKVLTGLGLEHVRLAGSGSAPIPADLIAWYRSLGLNLLEGYAMSEDFAYSHLSTLKHNAPGYVGVPYPEVEVKLSEAGEILIKSPGKMVGYYKLDEETATCFTEDGFFKTGDKGERTKDGLLKITGRVKEIFKTSKGKYVAPAPIENVINNHEHVELSCVAGSGQPQPYATVVLAEGLRPKMTDEAVRKSVHAELESLLKQLNAQLEDHEHLQFFAVVTEEWSPGNGLLTPTLKIRRSAIESRYAPHLEGWYTSKTKVVWHD